MSKEVFKCSYCGKEHERAVDRAECEIKCDKEAKTKLEQEKQKKLQAEEAGRLNAIQNTYDLLITQMSAFKNDYHKVIRIQDNSNELFPSLLGMFDLMRF